MATLKAAVTARYSNTYLVQLTNPDTQGAESPDEARLDLAVSDAEREFEMRTATIFDPDNTDHLYAGVEGVIYYLKKRMGVTGEALTSEEDKWRELLRSVAMTQGKNRSIVGTSSNLTIEKRGANSSQPVTQKFSPRKTSGYRISPPRG